MPRLSKRSRETINPLTLLIMFSFTNIFLGWGWTMFTLVLLLLYSIDRAYGFTSHARDFLPLLQILPMTIGAVGWGQEGMWAGLAIGVVGWLLLVLLA